MAYQSLYRRYRSQNFDQIKGQPHITQALKTAIKEGRHSHAYLFSGPRGTGKTSTARVLAKALNCNNLVEGEPCTTCTSCVEIEQGKSFDLHELDAASNNKVDDVRDLIAKVALGSPGRTKVYILDEVHMLTPGAENALLKTLEEPPEHVVFVLATTEPHKVVPTIRSRTQHFEFHLLPGEDLEDHLRFVIADAGLDVDQDGIDYALRQGGGSARDTLSALDLVAAAGGVPEGSNVGHDLAIAIGAKDAAATIAIVQRALETGREPRIIGENTLDSLRNAFLSAMGAPLGQLSESAQDSAQELASALGAATITRSLESIGQALVEMRQSPDPRVPLEVTLLKLARRDGSDASALLQRIETLETEVAELKANGVIAATPATAAMASPAPTQPATQSRQAPPQSQSAPAAAPAPAPAPPATPPPSQQAPAPQTQTQTQTQQPDATTPSRAPGGPGGPAAAARASLAESAPETVQATAPPAQAAPRPQAPPAPAGSGTPAPKRQPPSAPRRAPSAPTSPPPVTEPVPAATAAVEPEPATEQPQSASGRPITLDQLVGSFTEILEEVPQKVRARFRLGQFVSVDGDSAAFGLPNEHVIGRCEEVRSEVERALAARFNRPITIALIVDSGGSTTSAPPTKSPTQTQDSPADSVSDAPEDIGDVSQLKNAPGAATSGIDRLTEAFPGAELIEPQD